MGKATTSRTSGKSDHFPHRDVFVLDLTDPSALFQDYVFQAEVPPDETPGRHLRRPPAPFDRGRRQRRRRSIRRRRDQQQQFERRGRPVTQQHAGLLRVVVAVGQRGRRRPGGRAAADEGAARRLPRRGASEEGLVGVQLPQFRRQTLQQ